MNSEEDQKDSIVVTDTSCFILLEKINALYVLHELFKTVLTTPEIANEYGRPLPERVIITPANNHSLQQQFAQYVDAGEASAIALAAEINCDYVILGDIAARKLAVRLGLPVKGTVGVLLYAKQNGIIPMLRPYIELVQQTNFRLSQQLADQFILDAGE
jgi:predicted nucleic acid-binding protein